MQDDSYPEILTELKEIVSEVLLNLGLDQDLTHQSAHKIAETVRQRWGGTPIYIPIGHEYILNQRDKEIWDKFNGHNHRELCHQYNMSLQRMYKIIGIQQQADLKDRQTSLIEDSWSPANDN